MTLPPPPSAEAARSALASALTDAPAEVRVSWWDDGLVASRDVHPGDVGPHWRGPLAALAELISAERSVTAAKGAGRALCGAAVRRGADGWRRRASALDGWALAQADLDPPAAGPGRGEGAGPSVASVAAGLRALGIAAVVHPSPSARVGGGASTRVRAWVAVASEGAAVEGDASALAHAGGALATALGAALGADPRGVDRAKCSPVALGFTSAVHAAALDGVELCAGRAVDPLRLASAAVAAGWWHPFARGRVGPVARDPAALAEFLGAVEALRPGTIGRVEAGATCLRCPRAAEHTDGRGAGADRSCAVTADGWAGCSHSHGGDGPLTLRGLAAAWGVGLDASARGELSRALRAVEAPRLLARLDAPHAGAPGDVAPGVRWEMHPPAPDIAAARAGAVEALRRAVHAWGAEAAPRVCVEAARPAWLRYDARRMTDVMRRPRPLAGRCGPHGLDASDAGSVEGGAVDPCDASAGTVCRPPTPRPEAWVILAPMGSGKSTAALAELPALLPPPPGWTDDRAPSPRPLGAVVVETRTAARTVAATLQRAASTHPGAVEGLRVARHLPVSRVALGGGEALTDDTPRECAHPDLAATLESRGLPVGGSLCRVVGTDDPARVGLDGTGRPCPRLARCPAAAGWVWADGAPGAPAAGDRWIAVATADASAALPPVVRGGPHVVDECSRLASTSPVVIPPDGGAILARAEALRDVLPRDGVEARARLDAAGRPWGRSVVAATWAGLVAWVQGLVARGGLLAPHGLGADVASRRSALVAALDGWASTPAPAGDAGEAARRALARAAWPAVGGAAGALAAWERAAPTVGAWRRAEARAAGGELWRALAAWVAGAEAVEGVEAVRAEGDGAEADAWTERPTGGAVVRVPHVAAREARGWITRGPVVGLDGTADASALARALGALDPGGPVGGVRAVALAVADPRGVEVRRVILATERAGRGRVLGRDGAVAWPVAGGIVRAVLATLLREAPARGGASRHGRAADDGAALAPGMVLAPRPLALALAALAEGLDGAAVPRGGPCSATLGASLAAAPAEVRAAVARSVEAAPAEVRADASALASRASVRWGHHGGAEARGSNALADAGGRWVATLGDGRAPAAEARARGTAARRDPWAQGERDAAEALAQAHARVRAHGLAGGAVLLLHAGAVRPLGWEAPEVRPLDAPGASAPTSRRALPVSPRVEASEVSPSAHPHVAALLSRGWTLAALAACAGCDPRVARRWARGAHPRDPGALAALAAAVEAGDDVRAPWRRVLRPGRRAVDILRGARGVPGLDGLAALAVAEGLASAGGVALGLRPLAPGEVSAEGLAAWVRGDDAAVTAEVAAALAAVGPMVARWWAGGAPAEASTRGEVSRALTRGAAPAEAGTDALTLAAVALASRVAEGADAPRRWAVERARQRALAWV